MIRRYINIASISISPGQLASFFVSYNEGENPFENNFTKYTSGLVVPLYHTSEYSPVNKLKIYYEKPNPSFTITKSEPILHINKPLSLQITELKNGVDNLKIYFEYFEQLVQHYIELFGSFSLYSGDIQDFVTWFKKNPFEISKSVLKEHYSTPNSLILELIVRNIGRELFLFIDTIDKVPNRHNIFDTELSRYLNKKEKNTEQLFSAPLFLLSHFDINFKEGGIDLQPYTYITTDDSFMISNIANTNSLNEEIVEVEWQDVIKFSFEFVYKNDH